MWSGRRGSNSRHSAWKAEALPTELLPLMMELIISQSTKTDHVVTINTQISYTPLFFWWWGEDLNLRRLSRQIYSLIPLTTREPHQILSGADTPNRTEDILITSEMLYQLSYIGFNPGNPEAASKRPGDNIRAPWVYQLKSHPEKTCSEPNKP